MNLCGSPCGRQSGGRIDRLDVVDLTDFTAVMMSVLLIHLFVVDLWRSRKCVQIPLFQVSNPMMIVCSVQNCPGLG